jgi:hypothetical protein
MSNGTKVKVGIGAAVVIIGWLWAQSPTCQDDSGILYQGCLSQQPIDPSCREVQFCKDHLGNQWYVTTYPDGTQVKSEVVQ